MLFTMMVYSSCAQDLTDCEKDIHRIYEQNEAVKPDKKYYVKYGVQSVYKDKNVSSKEVVFTMVYDNYQLHVLSDMMNTYADTVTIISVSKLTKKIVVGNNTKKQFSKMLNSTAQLSDSSLWSNFTVSSCQTVSNHKEYDRQTVLQPKKKGSPLKEVSYFYRKDAAALYKMRNTYNSSSELQELNYTFYKVDHAYKGADIKSKNVMSIFFDSKGKLLPAYTGYELIDQRNKK